MEEEDKETKRTSSKPECKPILNLQEILWITSKIKRSKNVGHIEFVKKMGMKTPLPPEACKAVLGITSRSRKIMSIKKYP